VEHAKTDRGATAVTLLRMSLEYAIQAAAAQNDDCCAEILLEAGMNPSSRWAWDAAIQQGNEAICRLLVQYGGRSLFIRSHGQQEK
jgi:hypothetical protein